ncbi:MAG: T9SS type A sorting domain-containing protein, partial [Elusimicrobiales bacterium]|nr:T9SS type A sorting domain-containing protein [Elusimicrobiales bacterium]
VQDQAGNASAESVAVSTATRGLVYAVWVSTASSSAMQLSTSAMLYATFHLGGHPTVPASLSRINVTLTSTGTLRAADVANVNIYRDNNNNGVLDAGDPMIGSRVVNGASAVAVDLTSPLVIPTDGSSKSVFVVYEFAADAVVGHTLGARINNPADLVVNDPFSITDATFPFVSSQTTVLDGPNLLNVSISDAGPGSVQPGQSNVSVLKLQMQTNTGSSILQSLTLHIDGTAAFSDLANVNVYEDANQSGAWDAGDTLIGNGTFAAADSAINFTSPPAPRTVGSGAPSYYFVTVDISAGASLGGYFRLSVSTPSALALATAPEDAVVLSTYPAYSGDVYIQSQSTATITLSAIPHSEFYQGGLYMVALASCSVDTGKAYLHTVKVNRTGSSADADVSDVRVYQKGFADGSVNLSSYDTLIGSAAFSGNSATVHIATVTLQYPNPKQLLIAYNVAPSANPGGMLGLSITNGDYFVMSSSYVTVNMTPAPFTVTAAQVKQTSNPFRIVSFLDMTGGSLMQGTTNNAMLKLTVRSELNPVTWTSLTLHGTGSGILPPHNYVTRVKLYKDDGSGFHPSAATLVTSGSDVFDSAGNVTLALDQQVYAPASYYVAFDMHVDAQVGYDAGVEITTTSWFSVNSPSFISTNSLSAPYSAGPVDITQYANTVTISTSSLVPGQGAYPGATDVGVMKLALNTDVSKANFLSIKINRGGTSSDSDVSAVKVYYDANNYGDFLHPLAQYQLITPSTVTFNTDGVAYSVTLGISTTGSAQQLTPTPANYFVAVDIAPGATVGRTVVLRSLDKNYFSVSVPNRVADGASFTSPALLIRTPPQTVSSYFESKISTTVLQGQTAVLVASFTVAASSYTVSFTSLQAQRAGNGADSDVTKLSLYRDSGNGTWGGAGEDVFVASAAFSGQIAAFTLPSETITWPAPNLYYIVADMSQTAKYGKYFGISVSNPAWLTFNEPHEADAVSTNIPFASTQALISAVVNTLVVDSHNSAVLARQCDANKALGWFDMHTDNNAVQLNSVRFTASGTASESEVYNIRLYKDNGDNTFTFDDQLVTQSSNAFSGGQLSLQLPTAQTITTAPQRYFVTADISCTAAWGATFGMTVSSAAISVSEPNIVSVTGSTAAFSMDSGGIRHLPSTVYMRFADQGLQSLYVGKTDTLLARLDFWNDRDKAYLGAIKLKVSDVTPGGLSAADLAAVKIYRDSDGNGAFSLADDALLGSAAVDAGQVEFSLPSSGDLITPATRSYFIAVDIGAGAAIGNTVNLSMTDSSYLSLLSSSLGTDNMAAFTRQATTDAGIRDLRTPTPPAVALYKANGLPFGASETNYNAYRTRLSYSWSSQAYQGTVAKSYYRLDTRPSTTADIITGWTPVGLDARIVIADLNLQEGTTYYLAVKTQNSASAYYSDITNVPFLVDSVVPYFNTADKDLPAPSRETGVMIMTWNQAQTGVSGLDYYQVQEQPSSTPLWTTVSTTTARTLMISNSGITAQNYAAQKMSFAGGAKGAAAAQLVRAPGVYSYRIVPVNRAGVAGTPTNSLRTEVNLSALAAIADASAYPNPFDSRKEGVTIYFASNQSDAATVTIYDMWGRKVTSLSDGAANPHRIPWDGADGGGRKVSKGVYLAVIKSGGTQTVVKIAVIH